MKHDQEKASGINFYWDGLKLFLDPHLQNVVDDYIQFAKEPGLDYLYRLWITISLNITEQDIEELMHVYNYGAQLYGDKNYKGLELQRIIEAMKRHLVKWICGIPIDEKSKYRHLSHVLANILIAAELLM